MGVVAFVKSLLGVCETKQLSHELWSAEGNRVRVKLSQVPDLRQDGGAVYLAGQGLDRPILVVRAGDGQYLAFTNRCTHVGHRKLDPVPGEPMLRCCSVGHSTFDYEGKRLGGPAKDPLTRHEVEQSEGDLIVKL